MKKSCIIQTPSSTERFVLKQLPGTLLPSAKCTRPLFRGRTGCGWHDIVTCQRLVRFFVIGYKTSFLMFLVLTSMFFTTMLLSPLCCYSNAIYANMRRMQGGYEKSRFSTNISHYLANDARWSHSYYGRRIGNRTQDFEWYWFE